MTADLFADSSGKSPDAFRTIREVSEELDVPQHVLRFWESRFSQIKPLKRAGGRRYYRPNDILLIRNIRHYLYEEGYTIKGVQKMLKEQGVSAFISGEQSEEKRPEIQSLPADISAELLTLSADLKEMRDDLDRVLGK